MPVPSKGQEGAGRGDAEFVSGGKQPRARSAPQSSRGWSHGSFPTSPAGTATRLSLTGLPPSLGTSARRKTLVMSGSLAFYPASQGAALFIHNLPAHPHPAAARLTARLCPEDSGLSGTSKALPSSAGGWQGGLEAGDGSGDSWIPIPAVRGEGFTRLLLIALNAGSGLLTQPRPKLHRDTNCSWGVWGTLPVSPERLRGISFFKSSPTTALSKSETSWERIRSLERARSWEALLLYSSTLLSQSEW